MVVNDGKLGWSMAGDKQKETSPEAGFVIQGVAIKLFQRSR